MKPNTTLPTNLPKTLLVTAAAVLFAASAYAAPPTPVSSCGNVITTPGKYFLSTDLSCSGGTAVMIAASKVDLDLRGHRIDGENDLKGIGINTVTGNVAINNQFGIFISQVAVNTQTTNNYTSHNVVGIEAQEFAAGNVFNGNTSFANTSFDLEDDNGSCTSNTWRGNFFGTSSLGCIQ